MAAEVAYPERWRSREVPREKGLQILADAGNQCELSKGRKIRPVEKS